ncbi:hypothetical protein QG87_004535 [Salmonella enterica subsp. enterica]|nr:hypothetical protein [Salmonella enterica subsp. enterica serovar Paratyphi A]
MATVYGKSRVHTLTINGSMLVGRLAGPLCSHIYNVGMTTFSLYFPMLTFYLVEITFN